MDEENWAIVKNDTLELVTLPSKNQDIGVKWEHKAKTNAKGEVEKYKSRVIAKARSKSKALTIKKFFALVA